MTLAILSAVACTIKIATIVYWWLHDRKCSVLYKLQSYIDDSSYLKCSGLYYKHC